MVKERTIIQIIVEKEFIAKGKSISNEVRYSSLSYLENDCNHCKTVMVITYVA